MVAEETGECGHIKWGIELVVGQVQQIHRQDEQGRRDAGF